MSEIVAIGVSHRTAPVAVRERLAPAGDRAGDILRELRSAADVHETIVISTFNRTELYLVAGIPDQAERDALAMLCNLADIELARLAAASYSHRNCDAARHLYRVTAGLESVMIGEAEIQAQVRRSYQRALKQGTTGPLTSHLFKAACATAERVHGETGLANIDDPERVIASDRNARRSEIRKAEDIIEQEVALFAGWLGSLEVLPTLAALRGHAHDIAQQVIKENAGKWESATARDLERVDAVAHAVVNDLLRGSTTRLKALRDQRLHARMALLRDLFGINGDHDQPADPVAGIQEGGGRPLFSVRGG